MWSGVTCCLRFVCVSQGEGDNEHHAQVQEACENQTQPCDSSTSRMWASSFTLFQQTQIARLQAQKRGSEVGSGASPCFRNLSSFSFTSINFRYLERDRPRTCSSPGNRSSSRTAVASTNPFVQTCAELGRGDILLQSPAWRLPRESLQALRSASSQPSPATVSASC